MKLKKLFLALVSLAMLSSCNMMKEDEDLTNCGLFVTFKYDYNLQRSDMFGDHVGGVTLYVFDSDGRYLRSYESNDIPSMGMMLDGEYVHAMQILDLPNGKYRFIALANQKSYEATLATPGAKYVRTTLSSGDNNEKLQVTLDREAGTGGANPMVSNVAPLDTLWHGMTGAEPVQVKNNGKTVTKISMVRDTKMLTVSLHNLDEDKRADMDTDDFDYFIVDNNGRLAYNNDLLPDDDLVYTPFHKWNTYATNSAGTVTEATAHAGLTFNRLIWSADPNQNALLIIRNKKTGKEIAAINLTDALAQGRNAYDAYAYSRQEYLDRSYDYYLDFFIKNDVWQYAEVRINVLSWAMRIQNVNLK
ncbi:MAG: FimB/Mfa2 family fimbrial subunit [Prevotella sp.]|nr:FimB/Mfa2 family fimbrial subunit [Prevotella sp.]